MIGRKIVICHNLIVYASIYASIYISVFLYLFIVYIFYDNNK